MSPVRVIGMVLLLTQAGCVGLLRGPSSRGRPSGGWLANAVRLADAGRGWQVLRNDAQGGQHWGTARLVTMVTHVALAVSPSRRQVPLVVGDLSARYGGHIAHHASHRTGRDVDLLFFARDATTGASVLTPDFVHYDRTGASVGWPTALRFDTPRNWELVEALVRNEAVGISWIFVATWLERILLDHARALRRPEEVIARAEALMHQPGDSAPHDDHFHVRVLCTPEERAQGCLDWGPIRPWNERAWEKGDSVPCDDETVLAALEPLEPQPPPRRSPRRR